MTIHLLDDRGYVSQAVFDTLLKTVRREPTESDSLVQAAGDLIRYNTLVSVARAGTGHLGAALSQADLLAELYFRRGQFGPESAASNDRDVFVLSKGHAAPSHYAVLAARRYFSTSRLDRLRRWGGLPGHSHVTTPGVDGNTGSLAMGMSKAVGYALGKQRFHHAGSVYTIVGDGELQEGQIWEAALSAVNFDLANFYLIIDVNEVQTDQYVDDILVYADLAGTFQALGFAVAECDGHDAASLREAFDTLDERFRPKCLLAHTIKGRGVGFMEHTAVLATPGERYIWHNKPPNAEQLTQALDEILDRVGPELARLGVAAPATPPPHKVPLEPAATGIEGKPIVPAFAEAVVSLATADPRVVVLDADLEEDCGLSPYRKEFPERFFELGIMEQHMCSAASALCAMGYVPVINSYAAFLTSRSNEQIYNLATDRNARFLLVGHLAGVIPATPGMSHQAFRDISCLRSVPGLQLYQPTGPGDCRHIVERYGKGETGGMLYLRVVMAPSAVKLTGVDTVPPVGQSQLVRHGKDAILVAAGPVMVGEAVAAADALAVHGIQVEVRAHPWVAAFAPEMLRDLAGRGVPVIVAEDHYRLGGLGEGLFAAAAASGVSLTATGHVALKELPDTGFRVEALAGMGIGRDAIATCVRGVLVRHKPATGHAAA